jgi:branched-chain amino acid aminotransferase
LANVHPFAYYNGEIVNSSAIHFSPFQTGLLSGWGLFSTLRIYQGVPFALQDHIERLAIDGGKLHVELGNLLSGVPDAFEALIERNDASEAMARIYFVRNRGGLLDFVGQRDTDLLIFTAELRNWGATAKLRLQPHGRHAQSPLAGTKTLTWAHNLVLLESATRAGFDDVLLLNERGEVAECTSANVFIVRNGELLTPSLDSGALPGVSRKVILRFCARYGIKAHESVLFPDDLYLADEVFISSTTREVQPVSHIDDRTVAGEGPLARRIEELFRHEVEEYVGSNRKVKAHARR